MFRTKLDIQILCSIADDQSMIYVKKKNITFARYTNIDIDIFSL